MKLTDADVEELRRLEESLWRRETRFDRRLMEEVFAPDFFEIGRSGRRYAREDSLTVEPQEIDAVIPLPEFSVRELSDDVVQVTYLSAVTYNDCVEFGHRSSIWSRVGERWQIRFHQGTPEYLSE